MIYYSDFNDPQPTGKNLLAICPLCNKRKLSIKPDKRIFKCFHADCQEIITGRYVEGVRPDGEENELELLAKNKEKKQPKPILKMEHHSRRWRKEWQAPYPEPGNMPFNLRRYKALTTEKINELIPLTADRDCHIPEVENVQKYLEKQHISVDAAIRAGVMCMSRKVGIGIDCYRKFYISYVTRVDGKIINVKNRNIDDKSDWDQWSVSSEQSTNQPIPPFNIDCLNPKKNPDLRQLIITEGEKDALAVMDAGFPNVISVPLGAGQDPGDWIACFRPWLEDVGEIVFSGDDDEAGDLLKARIEYRIREAFGPNKLRILSFPEEWHCKDIADVFRLKGKEVVQNIIGQPTFLLNHVIPWNEAFYDGTIEYLEDRCDKGFDLGYGVHTDTHMRFTSLGDVIIVTGTPGSGKSDFVHDMLLHMMFPSEENIQKKRVGICSFEHTNKAKVVGYFVQRMLKTCETKELSKDIFNDKISMLKAQLTVFDYGLYTPSVDDILYDADRQEEMGHKLDVLLIDPYSNLEMNIDRYGTETEAIKHMLQAVFKWAHNRHTMVIIVAHPRKLSAANGTEQFEEINQYSIAGSSHWANFADYILTVKRDHRDEVDFTEINMIKVRDQDICKPGKMYFVRGAGRCYSERASIDACMTNNVEIAIPSTPGF